ncbi:Vps51/Vps67-domain-containing protein [Amylocarpus encephaloides]|uniref:Vacuolar protein sorting-associated protein 51 homolog n=1 Tax=Amylocarpus encephaloides TaxID=45428 RepID=A0A9P8C2S9_9HELO|nr:Vps51/Vps67-domain-containing protein [Amylocarpus encephaloides]
MSTIAPAREPSITGRRTPLLTTPSPSTRPSIDIPRSTEASPNRAQPPKRANRAALREYYNLKAAESPPNPSPPSETSSIHDLPLSPRSILDSADFDAQAYVRDVLATQSLGELLRTYNGVLGDIRALDAERKALVYDNYSKLIAATETIRRMREDMGREKSVGGMLDPAIRGVYARAGEIAGEWRETVRRAEGGKEAARKEKTRRVVERVLGAPGRVRGLMVEGREEEARRVWERELRLLERWRERGVGGGDVGDCIEEGKRALRGEAAGE